MLYYSAHQREWRAQIQGVIAMSKFFSSFLGALVGAVVDLLVNLIAAGFLKNTSIDQFIGSQGIWILVALVFLGLVMGLFFGKSDRTPSNPNAIRVKNFKTKRSEVNLSRSGGGGGIEVTGGKSIDS